MLSKEAREKIKQLERYIMIVENYKPKNLEQELAKRIMTRNKKAVLNKWF